MAEQVFNVAVTPAQRIVLLNLSHSEGQKLQGQRGRVFRRFIRAFAIDRLLDAANAHGGKVSVAMASSSNPSVFTLTAENIDYALSLLDVERKPVDEMTVGPLFDVLEDVKAGRADEPPIASSKRFDPDSEDWAPPSLTTRETPLEQRIADYLRASGETRAAELVDRGGWDKPASNGAPPTGNPVEAPPTQ